MTDTAPGTEILFVGTSKGLYRLHRNAEDAKWNLYSTLLEEYDLSALNWDARNPALMLFGTASGDLFVSRDSGATWEATGAALAGRKIWTIAPDTASPARGFYLGLDGGYLFYYDAIEGTCQELAGLRALPEAEYWFGPFGPAIFHSILPVPGQAGSIYAGLSVVGILNTHDGGLSWRDTTANIPKVPHPTEGGPQLADIHKLALHPQQPNRLYATTHYGTFRSDDGSQSWENISAGLPFEMTRPLALHPNEPDTVFVIAHEDGSDSELPIIRGPLQVYRSRDGGRNWQALGKGLPLQANCAVLREALISTEGSSCALYLGTNRGQIFASQDEGDSWELIAELGASARVLRLLA